MVRTTIILLSLFMMSCANAFEIESTEDALISLFNRNADFFESIESRYEAGGIENNEIIEIEGYKMQIITYTNSTFVMEVYQGYEYGLNIWQYAYYSDTLPSTVIVYQELWPDYDDLRPYSYGHRYLKEHWYLTLASPNQN